MMSFKETLRGEVFTNNSGDTCEVVNYENSKKVFVRFDGYSEYEITFPIAVLRTGEFRNLNKPVILGVGFRGIGEHTPKKDYYNFVYNLWKGMLYRCYDEKTQEKIPTYKGCTVCKEWYNFQVFAEWYINHEFYGLGYELDKDLLSPKNEKIYSPETCTLLPSSINAMIAIPEKKNSVGVLGVGKVGSSFTATLRFDNLCSGHLGTFKTVEEASAAYVQAKERYVKNKALSWANRIEWRAFKALMEWKVYPDQV